MPINLWACAAALIAHDKNMTFSGGAVMNPDAAGDCSAGRPLMR
jgi:hypothetical protein